VLADPDPLAANTLTEPDRVRLRDLEVARDGGTLVLTVPSIAWVELLVEL